MIETLNERMQKRLDAYIKILNAEKKSQEIIDKILPLFPQDIHINSVTYTNLLYLYIYPKDIINFELSIISKISNLFNLKWEKRVEKDEISYIGNVEFPISTRIEVKFYSSDACKIEAIPTGKVKKVVKEISVDEMQYDYVVNCEEDF